MDSPYAFRLKTLTRWMAYALDAATAPDSVTREVDTHIARHPHLAAQRSLLADLLASKSAGARRQEATLGALRFEEHPTDGNSIASMVGWLVDRNPRRSVEQEIADNLARFAMQTRLAHTPQAPPRVRRVKLPYGEGVRLESARGRPVPTAPPAPTGHRAALRTVEYHIPLDLPPASLLFVRFMASNPDHVDRLASEFQLIVEDLQLAPAP
jgi:hypothetical protein